MKTPTTIRRDLEAHYLPAAEAAEDLGLDKSHLCAQLRAGKLPGAFQWGRRGVWVIPKVAVEGYRATHLNPDRHRQPAKRKDPEAYQLSRRADPAQPGARGRPRAARKAATQHR